MPARLIVAWRPLHIELPSFAAIDVSTAVMFPFTPLSWASRCVAEAVQVHRLRSPAGEDAPGPALMSTHPELASRAEAIKDLATTLQASDLQLVLLNKRDKETTRIRTTTKVRVDFILRANQVATALLKIGIASGDHVALCAPNSGDWLAFYFGVIKIGAVAVTLSSQLKADELTLLVNHSRPKAIFTHDEKLGDLEKLRDEDCLTKIICPEGRESRPTATERLLLPG